MNRLARVTVPLLLCLLLSGCATSTLWHRADDSTGYWPRDGYAAAYTTPGGDLLLYSSGHYGTGREGYPVPDTTHLITVPIKAVLTALNNGEKAVTIKVKARPATLPTAAEIAQRQLTAVQVSVEPYPDPYRQDQWACTDIPPHLGQIPRDLEALNELHSIHGRPKDFAEILQGLQKSSRPVKRGVGVPGSAGASPSIRQHHGCSRGWRANLPVSRSAGHLEGNSLDCITDCPRCWPGLPERNRPATLPAWKP